ncbi:MAG TPA: efflux RND transporter periplasmic adaptor subunit [Rhodopila sp.]|nr:efflux RND transporter periplasmic adaptor subunit [Rhodopila sp.]
MKKGVAIVGVCTVVAGFSAVAWRLSVPQAGAAPAAAERTETPATPVVAEKVQVSDIPLVMAGIGTVRAYNTVDIHAQVTGTIEQIGFVEGQTVHPGSLIAQLDPRPYQAVLDQAQANLARDEAHLTNAKSNLGRYIPLAKNGFASAQQVNDQSSAVSQLESAIISDKAAIFNAQTQLSYTTVTSPIEGVTGIRRVDIGNILQPSTTLPIVTITQVEPISVVFTLPQGDVAAVQAAMAHGALKTVALGQDDRSVLGEGTLLLVDNAVDINSGTIQLKATFPNKNRALWPGEFINAQLTVGVRKQAVSVPLTALQQGQGGNFVYVVQPDHTVRQVAVTIGQTLNGRALIEKGLTPNDTVVTQGQYGLSNGTKVAIVKAGDPHVQDSSEASAGML